MAAPGSEDVYRVLTFVLQDIVVPEKQLRAAETLEQLIVLLKDIPGSIDRVVPGITSAVTKAIMNTKLPRHWVALVKAYRAVLPHCSDASSAPHIAGQLRTIYATLGPTLADTRITGLAAALLPLVPAPPSIRSTLLRLVWRAAAWEGEAPAEYTVGDVDVAVQMARGLPEALGVVGEAAYTDTACITECQALIGFLRSAQTRALAQFTADPAIIRAVVSVAGAALAPAPAPAITLQTDEETSLVMPMPRSTLCKDPAAVLHVAGLVRQIAVAGKNAGIIPEIVQFIISSETHPEVSAQLMLGLGGYDWECRKGVAFSDHPRFPRSLTFVDRGELDAQVEPIMDYLIGLLGAGGPSVATCVRAGGYLMAGLDAKSAFDRLVAAALPVLLPGAGTPSVDVTLHTLGDVYYKAMAPDAPAAPDPTPTPRAAAVARLVADYAAPTLRRLAIQLPYPTLHPAAVDAVRAVTAILGRGGGAASVASVGVLAELVPLVGRVGDAMIVADRDTGRALVDVVHGIVQAVAAKYLTFIGSPQPVDSTPAAAPVDPTPEEPSDVGDWFREYHARQEEARRHHVTPEEMEEIKRPDPTPTPARPDPILRRPPHKVKVTVHVRLAADAATAHPMAFVVAARQVWVKAGNGVGQFMASSDPLPALRTFRAVCTALANDTFVVPNLANDGLGDRVGSTELLPLVHRAWPYYLPTLAGPPAVAAMAADTLQSLLTACPEFTVARVGSVLAKLDQMIGERPGTSMAEWALDRVEERPSDKADTGSSPIASKVHMRDPTRLSPRERAVMKEAERLEQAQHRADLGLGNGPALQHLVTSFESTAQWALITRIVDLGDALAGQPLDGPSAARLAVLLLFCMSRAHPRWIIDRAGETLYTLLMNMISGRQDTEQVIKADPRLATMTDPALAEPADALDGLVSVARALQADTRLPVEARRYRLDRVTVPVTDVMLGGFRDEWGTLRKAALGMACGAVADVAGRLARVRAG